jgi:hypothetical protein
MIEKTGDFWKSQDQGAATAVVAAFDPALSCKFYPTPKNITSLTKYLTQHSKVPT